MENKTKTDLSSYIVSIQGRDYITFPGLLAEAHAQGLVSIETNLVNTDLENPIVKTTVALRTLEGNGVKSFTGYGDANVSNVAKKVAGALLRMAETRSIARALRFACNIDMTALEELGVEDENVPAPKVSSPIKTPTTKTSNPIKIDSGGTTQLGVETGAQVEVIKSTEVVIEDAKVVVRPSPILNRLKSGSNSNATTTIITTEPIKKEITKPVLKINKVNNQEPNF